MNHRRKLALIGMAVLAFAAIADTSLAGETQSDEDRIWLTRDGNHLRYGEMTTEHLQNATRMLYQRAEYFQNVATVAENSHPSELEELTVEEVVADALWKAAKDETIAHAMMRVIEHRLKSGDQATEK